MYFISILILTISSLNHFYIVAAIVFAVARISALRLRLCALWCAFLCSGDDSARYFTRSGATAAFSHATARISTLGRLLRMLFPSFPLEESGRRQNLVAPA